ncbi:MAG: LysR family transcriptional regulator [Burkholderiaceae bacterium]
MDSLTSMEVFRTVAELKSFAAAARRLGMSAAMASKHVMHLEARLATRLLNRTSRHVSLTEAGAIYFDQTRQMLDDLREVETAVSRASVVPRGVLKLSAPVWIANPQFVAVLADYRARYPEVALDIDLSGRMVNLVEEGFDLVLRVSASPGDNLVARPVAPVSFCMVAAPAYLRKAGRPQSPAQLAGHKHLFYSHIPLANGWSVRALQADGSAGERELIKVEPVLLSTNESLLHLAALQGIGIAVLPRWLVQQDVHDGRLELLLPNHQFLQATMHALYPSRKFLSSKVRTFVDFLAGEPRMR